MGHIQKSTAKSRMANTDTEESEVFQAEFRKAYTAYSTERRAPREQGFLPQTQRLGC
jgi:hypothetical protein